MAQEQLSVAVYFAKMLSEMYSDEQNSLYVQFLIPIVDEFVKLNKVLQNEDPDPSKLFKDFSSFVVCLLHRIVLPGHASIDCDWESHVMHVRACQLGSVFRDALGKSSLSDERKNHS
ncbi:hypothetical protein HPB48_012058 [Haemaphysalis longicornis]|uniref:Uncharacterized protein n=1 Tax=Haemaphysalis longicornis TaxID=44386 RepID=A0A9J6H5J5_HAELO|nr:hypothetical protein HPB48_012058 [Haemaphysalis longicornis]